MQELYGKIVGISYCSAGHNMLYYLAKSEAMQNNFLRDDADYKIPISCAIGAIAYFIPYIVGFDDLLPNFYGANLTALAASGIAGFTTYCNLSILIERWTETQHDQQTTLNNIIVTEQNRNIKNEIPRSKKPYIYIAENDGVALSPNEGVWF